MTTNPRPGPGVFVVLAVVAFMAMLYCLSAIVMVGSFAASPGYSQERAVHSYRTWYGAEVASLVVFLASAVVAYKRFRNRHH